MVGWIDDRWVDEGVDGWMGEWVDEGVDGGMDCMDAWVDE